MGDQEGGALMRTESLLNQSFMKQMRDEQGTADGGQERSLWERILQEYQENAATAKAKDVYQLFVLGDRLDEKEHVVKYLTSHNDDGDAEDEPQAGGLSFAFGEWKGKPAGDEDDAVVRIVHTCVEKPSLRYLLPAYFLGGSLSGRFSDSSMFMITVDLSIPYCAMKRLNEWYKFVEETLQKACVDDCDQITRMKDRMEMQCDAFHTNPGAQQKMATVDSSLQAVDAGPASPTAGRSSAKYKKLGIFTKGNLGCPLIVVCTKSKTLDAYATNQTKDPKEKNCFLNYIQATLRKWSIERGAALFYMDGERAQPDVVREYLLYRVSDIPMSSMLDDRRQIARRTPAATISHTNLFIPAFADSLPQVAKLPLGKYADLPWEQVCPTPKVAAEEVKTDTAVPDDFSKWLGEEKTKAKDQGSLLGTGRTTKRAAYSDELKSLRDRTKGAGAAGGAGKSASKGRDGAVDIHSAEAFFSNIIKTYARDGGGGKSSSKSKDGKTASRAKPSASNDAPPA
eukprot:TRINITY_DN14919_c0_g1_i1.p1 TRINITY_DN14919_c0_g1~~TRINITY_DN14919_c0_g1_i1.p1  ORF type:complete len:511 (+),score=202.62 TRINITY_DN14919_c0_g1_i1:72-1604(+)